MSSRMLLGLRMAAPMLSKESLICQRSRALPIAATPLRQPLKSFQSSTRLFSTSTRESAASVPHPSNIVQRLGRSVHRGLLRYEETASIVGRYGDFKKRCFAQVSARPVAYWLLASAASVFGLVVFGGLTRLTESGLSITEWKPVTGSLPPMSDADWEDEFTKYQSSPEYKQLNPHMGLAEFKKIYYMEWGHRLWGRVVGLSFALPGIYFIAKRKVSFIVARRILGITALIGVQGAIGWWMVSSGLKDDLFEPGAHPRVSHYRLATHLGTAFLTYSAMLLTGLQILSERKIRFSGDLKATYAQLRQLKTRDLSLFRKSVAALVVLVFVTVLSGALVAGLDAGMIYNEWPTMGGGFNPPKEELFKTFYCRKEDGSDLFWRNMLENPSTVQLNHRSMAYATTLAVLSLFAYSRFSKVSANIPQNLKKSTLGVVHALALQVSLGISTLVYLVPVHLAAMHQAGSLLLFTAVLVLYNRTFVPQRTLNFVKGAFKQQQKRIEKAATRAKLAAKAHGKRGEKKPHVTTEATSS